MRSLADHMPSAKQDNGHVGLRASESFGYFGLGHRAAQAANFGYFLAGQKLLEERDATDIDRVLPVHSVVYPFEVSNDVIGLVTINVVDHRKVVRIGDKRKRHQSVDVDGLAAPFAEEIDVRVSKLVDAGPQHLTIDSSGFQPVADAIEASNATKITDLVEISEVSDRNGSPFFNDAGIHSTGRPSGISGSMIKGPSFAPTFGGSAFMARHSEGCNLTLQ